MLKVFDRVGCIFDNIGGWVAYLVEIRD